MGTLTLLKSRVASDLARGDLTSSSDEVAYAISDAVAEYKGKRFAFNQARDTFDTTAGTEFYTSTTIPTDIGEVDALTISVSGRRYKLDKWAFAYHEQMSNMVTSRGQPTAWSWYAEQIRLYPIPDATYTVTISYLQRIDLQALDAESSVWTTQAENLIRACAEKILYRDVIRDASMFAAAQSAERDAYRRLMREAQQLDTGSLAPSGI